MPRPIELLLNVSSTVDDVTREAAEMITETISRAVEFRGFARVALSGGSTPRTVFCLLADANHSYRARIAWDKLHLFWVDERCVGPDDPESNFGMTRRALLDKVPLPIAQIHRMEGELDPEEGASRYESEIRNAFKLEGAETPTFDLVLLGLGSDGHTASLFPHTHGIDEMARICMANHVPQKDSWRLTLTWPVITAGREVAFLIEGTEKAEMVRTVFAGEYDPETYPAQLIRPASGKLTLLMDVAAAAQLPHAAGAGVRTMEIR